MIFLSLFILQALSYTRFMVHGVPNTYSTNQPMLHGIAHNLGAITQIELLQYPPPIGGNGGLAQAQNLRCLCECFARTNQTHDLEFTVG